MSAMDDKIFIDSNVFLYAAETGNERKSETAGNWRRYLLQNGTGIADLQVLNEVASVLLKRGGMAPEAVFTVIDRYSAFGISPIGAETVAAARLIHFETRYSWWDCLLPASAIETKCRHFLSEDLRDGQRVRGLTIMSPFLHSPPQAPLH